MGSESGVAASQLRQSILNCRRLPSRLTSEESAAVLGFNSHDIPVLVAGTLLMPLGDPAPNAPKYFAASDILAHGSDPKWLDKATRALSAHWKEKNTVGSKKLNLSNGASPRHRRPRYATEPRM